MALKGWWVEGQKEMWNDKKMQSSTVYEWGGGGQELGGCVCVCVSELEWGVARRRGSRREEHGAEE